jgi:hypothetical protein
MEGFIHFIVKFDFVKINLMSEYKFSGHDTFYCKQQWLLKGVELVVNEGVVGFSDLNKAIPKLGVGKNMVLSIQYWMKSFGLLEGEKLSSIAELLFSDIKAYDKYLEDEGSLWLLQYLLCKHNYASIYQLIFSDYFRERVSNEFTENQIISFIQRKIIDNKYRGVSENTLRTDFKVFSRTYVSNERSYKSIEDDYNSPLLELNLVSIMSRKVNGEEVVFKINKETRVNFPFQIFGYCLIDLYGVNCTINYQAIRETLGNYFGLTNEGIELIVENLLDNYKDFVFNDDAGVRQIQIKTNDNQLQSNLLNDYYAI